METRKRCGNSKVCKSLFQKQTSPHSCVNPHDSPGEQFFYLDGTPQSVPISAQSRRCRSHCAQPPSSPEVNPPQTSASMPCFLWLPARMFSTGFSSAGCICPICGGLHTSPSNSCTSELRLSRVWAGENGANTVASNFSSNVQVQSAGFKDEPSHLHTCNACKYPMTFLVHVTMINEQ